MKKLTILTAAIMFSGMIIGAQNVDPELDYTEKTYSKDKRTLVGEYMNLSPLDSIKFWPLYGNYETGRQKISAIRLDLIRQYVNGNANGNLSPDLIDKSRNVNI